MIILDTTEKAENIKAQILADIWELEASYQAEYPPRTWNYLVREADMLMVAYLAGEDINLVKAPILNTIASAKGISLASAGLEILQIIDVESNGLKDFIDKLVIDLTNAGV